MKKVVLLFVILMAQFVFSQSYKKSEPLVHTYSIVAMDSITGDMGVAVQSHWFSVGTTVTYGEAGVGVVATQSLVNPMYGPKGLALMKQGLSARQAMDVLIENDDGHMYRQVAMLNTHGDVAAHTGSSCIDMAGDRQGKNFSVQANMMLNNTVWDAMAIAFESKEGTLAERMLASLQAAENEKGDIRGKQSAAILIVKGRSTGNSWEDIVMDLRVEDHKDPIQELGRIMRIHQAYDYMNKGDLAMEEGNSKEAEHLYLQAQKMFPDNLEMKYWYAVNLLNNREITKALPILKSIFNEDKNWQVLIPRLVKSKLLIISDKDLSRVMSI